jgi:hypothetical protein
LKRVQRAMLWYGMPITLLLICALVLMRDYEVHTFHVTPTLAANALRSVLLAAGHKEVAAPEQASVLWTDAAVHQTLTTSAVRTQRVNTLPGMVPARPDAACRALAEARAPLDRIVRVAECLVLPQQADEVRAAIVRDGGRAMWELEPADATAYMMLDSAKAAGRPIPSLTNNPDALPQRGSWAVRRLDERPHLLGGRRFCIQLFVRRSRCACTCTARELSGERRARGKLRSARRRRTRKVLADSQRLLGSRALATWRHG